MLKELHLKGVGPADQFDLEYADRLNILTSDNGGSVLNLWNK